MFRRNELKINNRKYIIEEFDNVSELLDKSNTRPINFDEDRYGDSFEKAKEMLKYGCDEKIDFMKEAINPKLNGAINKITFVNDVVGFAPIVPNAIKGIPQAMINNVKRPVKSKIINIVFNAGTPWFVEENEVFAYGQKVLNKIINLEMQGFRVKLYSLLTFNTRDDSNNYSYFLKLLIKRENQPLDVKRIIFPMLKDKMQRQIAFDWYRKLPGALELAGYGKELTTFSESERKTLLNPISEKNTYYICYNDDLDEIFKDVK